MRNITMVLGSDIYSAAIAGAREGYNRSTDDHSVYVNKLKQCYENCLADVEDEEVRNDIHRNTLGDWRRAHLPLSLALIHTHKFGQPCKPHARVYLSTDPSSVFDIPLDHWNRFLGEDDGQWYENCVRELSQSS
jgi:hypothetical protein